MGRRALVVTGASPERAAPLVAAWKPPLCVPFAVAGEPTIELVRDGAEYARRERCDLVVAMGGGSAIDAGKAMAAMLANPGDPLDYLEVIGRGQPLAHASVPFIAIPTTAGTGTEVTRNAVLASPAASRQGQPAQPFHAAAPGGGRSRADLRSAARHHRLHRPGRADATDRALRSVRANPMTDCSAWKAWAAPHGRAAAGLGGRRRPRGARRMAWASLLGGLALANAGLGAVHGFAAPVGGMFPAPHGAVCAALLPHVMAINVRALRRARPKARPCGAMRRWRAC